VARIDALGHVNRLLVGVRFRGDQVPLPGTNFSAGGKSVGQITSACYSPKFSAPLALGYVRRQQSKPGVVLDSDSGQAEVIALPLPA
jgi:glycine cleavage system aminomethyltransferase T